MPDEEQVRLSLQFLLARDARSAALKQDVKQKLDALGVELSGEGAATLSGSVTEGAFESLFGCPFDAATRPEPDLPIPDELKDQVESISIAPRHLYFE